MTSAEEHVWPLSSAFPRMYPEQIVHVSAEISSEDPLMFGWIVFFKKLRDFRGPQKRRRPTSAGTKPKFWILPALLIVIQIQIQIPAETRALKRSRFAYTCRLGFFTGGKTVFCWRRLSLVLGCTFTISLNDFTRDLLTHDCLGVCGFYVIYPTMDGNRVHWPSDRIEHFHCLVNFFNCRW